MKGILTKSCTFVGVNEKYFSYLTLSKKLKTKNKEKQRNTAFEEFANSLLHFLIRVNWSLAYAVSEKTGIQTPESGMHATKSTRVHEVEYKKRVAVQKYYLKKFLFIFPRL